MKRHRNSFSNSSSDFIPGHWEPRLPIPVGTLRKGRDQGAPIAELVPDLGAGHRITAVITVPQGALEHLGDEFAIIVTAMVIIKR